MSIDIIARGLHFSGKFPAGTVNLPALSLAGDSSVGFYRNAASQWTWTGSGADRFTLTAGVARLHSGMVFGWGSTSSTTGSDLTLSRAAAGVMALRGASVGGALEMLEMTAPAAGAANTVRLYAEDNGSGKTRLMAIFPTGAAQQVAIEP